LSRYYSGIRRTGELINANWQQQWSNKVFALGTMVTLPKAYAQEPGPSSEHTSHRSIMTLTSSLTIKPSSHGPLSNVSVPSAGLHHKREIRLSHGFDSKTTSRATPQPSPKDRAFAWAFVATGAITLGVAGLLYLDHLNYSDEATANLPTGPDNTGDRAAYDQALEHADFFYTGTLVAGAVGTTLIGLGLYWFLRTPSKPMPSTVYVTPNRIGYYAQF
ncbi:MAG: hypothetical protein VX589_20245, partial [Myxococcota bacterium]|nr:hypothetical protein [Myxococcota bacterium]